VEASGEEELQTVGTSRRDTAALHEVAARLQDSVAELFAAEGQPERAEAARERAANARRRAEAARRREAGNPERSPESASEEARTVVTD
jgi:hypothetical protein